MSEDARAKSENAHEQSENAREQSIVTDMFAEYALEPDTEAEGGESGISAESTPSGEVARAMRVKSIKSVERLDYTGEAKTPQDVVDEDSGLRLNDTQTRLVPVPRRKRLAHIMNMDRGHLFLDALSRIDAPPDKPRRTFECPNCGNYVPITRKTTTLFDVEIWLEITKKAGSERKRRIQAGKAVLGDPPLAIKLQIEDPFEHKIRARMLVCRACWNSDTRFAVGHLIRHGKFAQQKVKCDECQHVRMWGQMTHQRKYSPDGKLVRQSQCRTCYQRARKRNRAAEIKSLQGDSDAL